MANDMIPQGFAPAPTPYNGSDDALGAGIERSYGIIKYKGKQWKISYRKQEKLLELALPNGQVIPDPSLEVVIVHASTHKSKVWYEGGYVEGSNRKPDCMSTNGISPDASAPKKQAAICKVCPYDAFGSGTNGRGKACSDSKRLAVVPLNDLANELMGGPMLLRVPAGSFNNMGAYADALRGLGYTSAQVATRISFDANEAFPKFTFQAIRPLSPQENAVIAQHRAGTQVARIVTEDFVDPNSSVDPSKVFEQWQSQPQIAAPSQPSSTGAVSTTSAPSAAPAATPTSFASAMPAASSQNGAGTAPSAAQPPTYNGTPSTTNGANGSAISGPASPPNTFEQGLDAMLDGLLPS